MHLHRLQTTCWCKFNKKSLEGSGLTHLANVIDTLAFLAGSNRHIQNDSDIYIFH